MTLYTYRLEDFDNIPSPKELVGNDVLTGELPSLDEVKTLAKWTDDMREKFNRTSEDFQTGAAKDRSAALAELAYLGAENGWTDEQIAVVLYDADDRWGKYKGRKNRDRLLIDLVNRARQKYGYNTPANVDLAKLINSANQSAPIVGESQLIYGYDDFVKAEFRVEWILKDLLAQGGFGLVTGYPGTGKTQLCIAIGAHLALGEKSFLKWKNNKGTKKVMFLSLEMGAAPLNLFMSTIAKGYDDMRTLNRNFLVAPFGTPMPLDTEEGQTFMDTLMGEHMPDVVIVDSLQKIISKELTDEQGVKNLIHYLATMRSRFGCSLLVVHHNRKKANDAQKKSVELSDVYGSTYITTDVDFVLSLKQEDEEGMLTVSTLKNRLGPTIEDFLIYRDSDTLGFDLDLSKILHHKKEKSGGLSI